MQRNSKIFDSMSKKSLFQNDPNINLLNARMASLERTNKLQGQEIANFRTENIYLKKRLSSLETHVQKLEGKLIITREITSQ